MKDTVLIGICGRSGSGKSYVCSVFESYGGHHIDTDKVYHKLLEPVRGKMSRCAAAVVEKFGDEVANGESIDRRALAKIVFSDEAALDLLNKTVHPFILKATAREAMRCRSPFALIDAPVLFESGFDKKCAFTVCVAADDATCVKRITERDGVTEEEAALRLSNQIPQERLSSMCDYTVDNSYGKDVAPDVEKILSEKGLITK